MAIRGEKMKKAGNIKVENKTQEIIINANPIWFRRASQKSRQGKAGSFNLFKSLFSIMIPILFVLFLAIVVAPSMIVD